MARRLAVVLLAACLLVGGCAGQLDAEDVQAFVNVVSNKVVEILTVCQEQAPGAVSMLEAIDKSFQDMANSMWDIKWSDGPQSQYDTTVMLANTVVQQIWQIQDMVPESSGQTWGSMRPRDDLLSVGREVCDQVKGMQTAAQAQYSVLLTITSMAGCDLLEPPADAAAPAPAPAADAPAPADARRMLKA